ncbi:unnamed protein product, partial [Brenthis ino]
MRLAAVAGIGQENITFNSHWSCPVVVPPEYESDRNRECTCVCAYSCALLYLLRSQLVSVRLAAVAGISQENIIIIIHTYV